MTLDDAHHIANPQAAPKPPANPWKLHLAAAASLALFAAWSWKVAAALLVAMVVLSAVLRALFRPPR